MTKIILIVFIFSGTFFIIGCGGNNQKKKVETINPFSPDSMMNTYDTSKTKINTAVEKENNQIEKALNDSGLNN